LLKVQDFVSVGTIDQAKTAAIESCENRRAGVQAPARGEEAFEIDVARAAAWQALDFTSFETTETDIASYPASFVQHGGGCRTRTA
jgi:hypothetical protein